MLDLIGSLYLNTCRSERQVQAHEPSRVHPVHSNTALWRLTLLRLVWDGGLVYLLLMGVLGQQQDSVFIRFFFFYLCNNHFIALKSLRLCKIMFFNSVWWCIYCFKLNLQKGFIKCSCSKKKMAVLPAVCGFDEYDRRLYSQLRMPKEFAVDIKHLLFICVWQITYLSNCMQTLGWNSTHLLLSVFSPSVHSLSLSFYLMCPQADLNCNILEDSGAFYGVTSQYESSENMTITCSTKVCSFGKQVVEKVEVRSKIKLF